MKVGMQHDRDGAGLDLGCDTGTADLNICVWIRQLFRAQGTQQVLDLAADSLNTHSEYESHAHSEQTPEYGSVNRAYILRKIRKRESNDSTEHHTYKRTPGCCTESAFVSSKMLSQQNPRSTSSNPLETLIGNFP
jgi:hypothetical protein